MREIEMSNDELTTANNERQCKSTQVKEGKGNT
jgi:hypothetical protein